MKTELKEKHILKGHTKGGKQVYSFTEDEFDKEIESFKAKVIAQLQQYSIDATDQACIFECEEKFTSQYCSEAMSAAYNSSIDTVQNAMI